MTQRKLDTEQQDALNYLDSRYAQGKRGGFLYMQMRQGKSFVGIEFVKKNKMYPCLVLTVAKAVLGWTREMSNHGLTVGVVSGDTEKKRKEASLWQERQVTVSSYDTAVIQKLHLKGFKSIILDESYVLSNAGRNISSALWRNPPKDGTFRIAMSGSPYAESVLQIVAQFIATQGSIAGFTTPFDFLDEHTHVDKYLKRVPNAGVEQLLTKTMEEEAFISTREVAKIGGEKIYKEFFCDLSPELREPYNEIVSTKHEDPAGSFRKLWMITSGFHPDDEKELKYFHKHLALLKLLESGEIPQKVVIFCNFLAEIRTLVQFLCKRGYPAFGMDGSTSISVQKQAEEEFARREKAIIVLQEVAFKMGTDFSTADYIVYFSNSPSGDARIQSEDRHITRFKTTPVYVCDLLVRQGADTHVAKLARNKLAKSHDIMRAGANLVRRL